MGRQAKIRRARRICNQMRRGGILVDSTAHRLTASIRGGVRDRIILKIAGDR